MKYSILLVLSLVFSGAVAQYKAATIKEGTQTFPTYGFSDPNPIPEFGRIYPYFRFDGYEHRATPKTWKTVELENEFIKVLILPEIGGKIWAAWDKSTGKPFLYYNQVVKFRNVAMRGPWTSGGIEANYGIIGHTPNCATPVDYYTETKPDGSVSCHIGTLDLLTQTYWTIEINLPRDKGYFTTRSFWHNETPLEQPYYTWMNVGMPSAGKLEFVYPGNYRIGHAGEVDPWKIDADNGRDISFYDNNDYGGPKSFHIVGKHAEFFGVYYHDEDFGMARYSLRDDKPGRKIWMWGLSRAGMIWEDLLTDNDGQYVEIQSGRLFSQASTGSNYSPFKQLGFAPHTTDEWTEYWYPIKGTKGFVEANQYGALNIRAKGTDFTVDFMPLSAVDDELKVAAGDKVIYSNKLNLRPLTPFSATFTYSGNTDDLVISLGGNKLVHHLDPRHGLLSRPVKSPEMDWNSVFGLHTLGKELLQQRLYTEAEPYFLKALEKDPNYLPALGDLAMIAYRNLDYKKALDYASHAISIDTYDPTGNFYYALANDALGRTADAIDGFEIAALTPSIRGAAYTELARLYFRDNHYERARHYANRALSVNTANTAALQMLAVLDRLSNDKEGAKQRLARLAELTPLNHFVRYEAWRHESNEENKKAFTRHIRHELSHETYITLSDWYASIGMLDDAIEILRLSTPAPLVKYHLAWRQEQRQPGSGKALLEEANNLSADFVMPFYASTEKALSWAMEASTSWKPHYYLGLLRWSRNDLEGARALFKECGEPSYAPFYAARAELNKDESYAADIRKAAQLDPKQWRYGKLLTEHLLQNNNPQEALKVITQYTKRFPNDFRLEMLLASALLTNKQYKATVDLLNKTSILPYEGATEGRQMFREAWLMQAIEQLKAKKYKTALASIEKSKAWPENLGVGKPYDEDIDLRVENYLEALVYEKSGQKQQAAQKMAEIAAAGQFRSPRLNDLITALAMKRVNKAEEGSALLGEWTEKESDNEAAKWAYAAYQGQSSESAPGDNANARILSEIIKL